jgi:hypothetical protein
MRPRCASYHCRAKLPAGYAKRYGAALLPPGADESGRFHRRYASDVSCSRCADARSVHDPDGKLRRIIAGMRRRESAARRRGRRAAKRFGAAA